MNTSDRLRIMRRFNNLYSTVRIVAPQFSPQKWAEDRWDVRNLFVLSHVELEQLCAHMEGILSPERARDREAAYATAGDAS